MWKYCLVFALTSQVGLTWTLKPPLGESIYILRNFGLYEWTMRMITANLGPFEDSWIFREPSIQAFTINEEEQINQIVQRPSSESIQNANPKFDGKCEIHYCDDKNQLFAAYFRNFTIEKLHDTWRGFSVHGSRHDNRHFGIPPTFLSSDYSYILLRTYRIWDRQSLPVPLKNVNLVDKVDQALRNIKDQSVPQINDFMTNYGSHYIASYTTGDSLYQVFVYSKEIYKNIKAALSNRDVNRLTDAEMENYFSPNQTVTIGNIRSSSGYWLSEAEAMLACEVNSSSTYYMNLLKLHKSFTVVQKFNELLGNRSLLQIDLPIQASVFKNETQRNWFYEALSNLYVNIEINYTN